MKRKSLLDDVKALDYFINRLRTDESRCRSGQWIDVHRDIMGIIGELEKSKRDLIASVEDDVDKEVPNEK
jgi:hypothetical protein